MAADESRLSTLALARIGHRRNRLRQRLAGFIVDHHKTTCALANKLARICYAALRDHLPFDEAAQLNKKTHRQSFVMPA